jgi:hypothetical protein
MAINQLLKRMSDFYPPLQAAISGRSCRGFDEQIFGADEQVRGWGQSD